MSGANFRYIVLLNGAGAALFNMLLNGLIAWGLLRGRTHFPVWGPESVVGDTFITGFLLAFMTYLIVSRQTLKDAALGKVEPVRLTAGQRSLIERLPQHGWTRALAFGGCGVVLFALPVVVWLGMAGIERFETTNFILYKACFAGVEAALLTPLTVVVALAGTATAQPAATSTREA